MMRISGTGRTRILAALLVLLGLLAGTAPGQRSCVPIDQPQFLQVELLEVAPGTGYYTDYNGQHYAGYADVYVGLRALRLTYHSGRGFRVGISAYDGGGIPDLDYDYLPSGGSAVPIHVGYEIVLNPRKTAFFYGMVPSCYAEATLGALPLYAKIAAACDIDYYGLGIGADVGCFTCNSKGPPYSPPPAAFRPTIYAALKLRLLDAAFRLPGRHSPERAVPHI